MMMRSMPPASAHLAQMPVPAPPPMIGRPAATWARSRARHSSRVKKLMPGAGSVRPARGLAGGGTSMSRSSAAVRTMPSAAMTSGVCQRTRSFSGVVRPAAVDPVHEQKGPAEQVADDGQGDRRR